MFFWSDVDLNVQWQYHSSKTITIITIVVETPRNIIGPIRKIINHYFIILFFYRILFTRYLQWFSDWMRGCKGPYSLKKIFMHTYSLLIILYSNINNMTKTYKFFWYAYFFTALLHHTPNCFPNQALRTILVLHTSNMVYTYNSHIEVRRLIFLSMQKAVAAHPEGYKRLKFCWKNLHKYFTN